MNVYLRIELLGRELQGRLLLGLAAAERGHDVVLLDKATAIALNETSPGSLPPGYFHDNSPGQDGGKTILHESLAAQGWQITGQDEEHGLTTDDFQSDMAVRYPRRAMANKSAMFAFGPFDGEGIRHACPEYAERVVVTGSPRVDFWRKDFARYYELHPHPLGVERPPYALFLLSSSPFFAGASLMEFRGAEGDVTALMERADALRADGMPSGMSDAYRRVVLMKLAVEQVARLHPDVTMVYRPHPHEFLEAWQQVFEDAPPNVRVIRDNAVSPWLRNASCVVSSGSTVGFEAALADVPVVSFQPEGFDETPATSRMGHRATTSDEVARIVDAVLRGCEPELPTERASAMQSTIAERFFALDGRLAADRIVDQWDRLAAPAVRDARPVIPSDLHPRRRPTATLRASARRAFTRLGLDSEEREQRRRDDEALRALKFPAFDLDEVTRIHAALTGSLSRFSGVRITPVGPRVLHLTSR